MISGPCLILLLLRAGRECFNPVVHLDELRELLARHARPDQTTAIDGVLIAAVEQATPPLPSMSGTVLALVAQGGKRLEFDGELWRAVLSSTGQPLQFE